MKHNIAVGELLCLLAGCALLFVGCQGTPATYSPTRALNESELAIVGTWVGTCQNIRTPGEEWWCRFTLEADGTLSGNAYYLGPLTGTWTVSGSQCTARYVGAVGVRPFDVSFSGTVSGNTMSGTWMDNRGRSGPLRLTKQ